MDSSLSQTLTTDVAARCQDERRSYRAGGPTESSACVELFRRAFDQDQDAWEAIWITFGPLVKAWIGQVPDLDTEQLSIDAWINFSRAAPKATHLVQGHNDLRLVLGYLKTCTKTSVLMEFRLEARTRRTYSLEEAGEQAATNDHVDMIERRILMDRILARIDELLKTEDERWIFQQRFLLNMKPQDILAGSPSRLSNVAVIYRIIQQIVERLRRDPELQHLKEDLLSADGKSEHDAYLKIELISEPKDSPPMEVCELEIAILLDYISGVATIEERAAVERSPACVAAAQQLSADVLPLLQTLNRAMCPDAETLVAYQERRLTGPQYLIIYRHVEQCPLCAKECALLGQIDLVPLEIPISPLRRIIEAIRAIPGPLMPQLRGAIERYQTSDIVIGISTQPGREHPPSWTMRGTVHMLNGDQAIGLVDTLMLVSRNQPGQPPIIGEIEPTGMFVFRSIPAGEYELRISLHEKDAELQEVHIRGIIVGEQEF